MQNTTRTIIKVSALGVTPWNFEFGMRKLELMPRPTFSRFVELRLVTCGQTQTQAHSIYCDCIASRGKMQVCVALRRTTARTRSVTCCLILGNFYCAAAC